MIRYTAIAIILAVLFGALLSGCGENPATNEEMVVPEPDTVSELDADAGVTTEASDSGAMAPDFTLKKVGGGEVSLSDYEGRILVLDFWATWCGACVEELPEYQEMYEQWDHEKVDYLGVSLDSDIGTIEAWLTGHPELTLPIALGTDEMLDEYLPKRTIPAARVIGPDGRLRYELGPGPSADQVRDAVKLLLEEMESGSAEAGGA